MSHTLLKHLVETTVDRFLKIIYKIVPFVLYITCCHVTLKYTEENFSCL